MEIALRLGIFCTWKSLVWTQYAWGGDRLDEINRWTIAWHSTHYDFGNVKSKAKRWSLAGKYNYIISEYFEELHTENVCNLVVGA